MITNETKSLIEGDNLSKLLQGITDSVYIGLAEDISPSDISFWDEHEARLQEAKESFLDIVNEYFNDI